jgi:hypothetical protein
MLNIGKRVCRCINNYYHKVNLHEKHIQQYLEHIEHIERIVDYHDRSRLSQRHIQQYLDLKKEFLQELK